MLYRAHREASHPDYVQWGRRKVRLSIYLILPSWFSLIVVDALFGRFLTPDFLFAGVVAYVIGTVIVVMLVERRKIRELRAAWKETHPLFEKETKT
ncbi:hypothetical protein E6H33_07045 [Candidatus Bathyarchaeota archaeon]|nr:MAG: hypothetical protein E6H33_07045 [Candidatus Bathyarchaeota archaeon]